MKTAILIQDGALQVVLTPESKEEAAVLGMLKNTEVAHRYTGSFYGCQGGWTRWKDSMSIAYGGVPDDDESLILVLKRGEKVES